MEMSVTENKFIIMSRIAVLLRRKGLHPSLSFQPSGYLNLHVVIHDGLGIRCWTLDSIDADDVTEIDLLNWLGVLENE